MKPVSKAWHSVTRIARKVGGFMMKVWTVIFLTLAYFTVFAATALILKLLHKRQLIGFQRTQATNWVARPKLKHTVAELKKQF